MKLTIEQVKKIKPKTLLKIINKAKASFEADDVFKEMCKEYDLDVDIIDTIPIKFGDLDVSAKTDHGIITLNYKLLCDGDFINDVHYLLHEIEHYFQQCFGEKPTQNANDGEYLDNPFEQEAFQRQIQYMDQEFGEKEINKYIDHLLDHHDIENSSERKNKKNLLKGKI